jgi:hypothetical protein
VVQPAPPVIPPNITITEQSNNREAFNSVLTNVGVQEPARRIITNDGIDTISTLVDLYKEDIDGLEAYLKGINKTYTTANPPVRISPLKIGRLIGVLFVYAVSTEVLQNVLDSINIKQRMAQQYRNNYRRFKSAKSSDNEDNDIKLPKLEGHKNWIAFRDQVENKLSLIMGSKYLSLSYMIDQTVRRVTSAGAAMTDIGSIDVSDLSVFKTYEVDFGPTFNRDNATVWSILKTALLTSQQYNLIDTCDASNNGCKALSMLKSYYEGEDFVEATISDNLARVRSWYYHCETPKFNFDKFVQTQMECYRHLRDVGYNNRRGVDDATLCTDLISSIIPSADLEVALSLARNKGIVSNNYERLDQFFKAKIDKRNRRNKMWSRGCGKQIGAVGLGPGKNNRFKGGGRGRGRGGRMNGKERIILTKMVEAKEVRSTSYSADKFRKLSKN